MNTKHEEAFNETIGKRLSLLRQTNKMSLEYLGAKLGVSHQQVHKYETGESAIMPARLDVCAKLFNVPVGYFYGENETNLSYTKINKNILTTASEIQSLPDNVRKSIYNLSRQINKVMRDKNYNRDDKAA